MTEFELGCIFVTFCLIYGIICFGLGVIYAKRVDKAESDGN